MDSEKLVRLAAGGISTVPPFADKHPEAALPHARQALISAGIIKGLEKDARDRRTPRSQLPVCRQCGKRSGDMRSLHGPCGKCAFPKERRRAKTAGLARRFRLNQALSKAESLGSVTPKLKFDTDVADMKVQRRVSRVFGKGLDSAMSYSTSRGVLDDSTRQANRFSSAFGQKTGALWSPRSSFPYSGDLKVIALNPSSGMTASSRETLLDEHYRRMSAEQNLGMGDAAVRGALHGGLIGAGVVGIRAAAGFRASGMPLGDALHSAIGPAAVGGLIGAGLGIPAGIMKGYARSHEIRKARAYTGADLPTRRQMLRTEVSNVLR